MKYYSIRPFIDYINQQNIRDSIKPEDIEQLENKINRNIKKNIKRKPAKPARQSSLFSNYRRDKK